MTVGQGTGPQGEAETVTSCILFTSRDVEEGPKPKMGWHQLDVNDPPVGHSTPRLGSISLGSMQS